MKKVSCWKLPYMLSDLASGLCWPLHCSDRICNVSFRAPCFKRDCKAEEILEWSSADAECSLTVLLTRVAGTEQSQKQKVTGP